MIIGLLQLNPTVGDFAANRKKLLAGCEKAVALGAEFILAPELFLCGYPPRDLLQRADFVEALALVLEIGKLAEAAMAAAHHNLDNLCAIIDVNRLQIDGWVKDVMNVEPLAEKYAAFGWNIISIDGHDFAQILDAFSRAGQTTGRPTVILARTIKGKGVSFMENEASWHGTPPKKEQFEKALPELLTPDFPRARVDALLQRAAANAAEVARKAKAGIPKFVLEYWWNARDSMKVEMDPTRMGFGRGLERAGEDPRVVTRTYPVPSASPILRASIRNATIASSASASRSRT